MCGAKNCRVYILMQTQGFPLQENSTIGKRVGCGLLLLSVSRKNSLQQHLLGNLALISGMAESWLDFRAPTEIFSQGLKKPLAREREKPLQIFRQGRKNPAKIQTFR